MPITVYFPLKHFHVCVIGEKKHQLYLKVKGGMEKNRSQFCYFGIMGKQGMDGFGCGVERSGRLRDQCFICS